MYVRVLYLYVTGLPYLYVCGGILIVFVGLLYLYYVRYLYLYLYVSGLPYLYVCGGIGARVPFSTESSSNGLSGGP